MTDLLKWVGNKVMVTFGDGETISGVVDSFTGALDNAESGEDELNVVTPDHENIQVIASEIASIQVLEPAQSKKHFPLVAASL
ncbi:MAG: hypothetical protein LBC43_01380 [Bifidobacteriaceae bacterium]|jgi:hypothetical protein|nr:hypothetical protein [Bifidobacteriaceae bacterium]